MGDSVIDFSHLIFKQVNTSAAIFISHSISTKEAETPFKCYSTLHHQAEMFLITFDIALLVVLKDKITYLKNQAYHSYKNPVIH